MSKTGTIDIPKLPHQKLSAWQLWRREMAECIVVARGTKPYLKGKGEGMDLRSIQKPLKEKYLDEPGSSRITLLAQGTQTDTPIACSVDIGRAIYEAQAHEGAGGAGTAACSGDLLLGALAACTQITCQMVAEAMDIKTE